MLQIPSVATGWAGLGQVRFNWVRWILGWVRSLTQFKWVEPKPNLPNPANPIEPGNKLHIWQSLDNSRQAYMVVLQIHSLPQLSMLTKAQRGTRDDFYIIF